MPKISNRSRKGKHPETLPLLFDLGKYDSTHRHPDAIDLEGDGNGWGLESLVKSCSLPEKLGREHNDIITPTYLNPALCPYCQQRSLPEKSIREPKFSGWVEIYKPSNREQQYYRYVYVPKGGRAKFTHIRGGNVNNPESQRRKSEIDEAIAQGKSPSEIMQLC